MTSAVDIIFTIVGAALVLLSVYGAVKLNRRLFMSGFCFFSILPIIGESMAYNADKASVHVLVIFIFLVQFIIQFPDKQMYGRENSVAVGLATKIGLGVLVINLGAIVYVFHLNSGVAVQFGYYHVAFALLMIYVMVRRFTSKISWAR
jgi:hypothetical protein